MRKSRFSDEQIIGALKRLDGGAPLNDSELRRQLDDLALRFPRYGYLQLGDRLRRQGHYHRRRKRARSGPRQPLSKPTTVNERLPIDFVSYYLRTVAASALSMSSMISVVSAFRSKSGFRFQLSRSSVRRHIGGESTWTQ